MESRVPVRLLPMPLFATASASLEIAHIPKDTTIILVIKNAYLATSSVCHPLPLALLHCTSSFSFPLLIFTEPPHSPPPKPFSANRPADAMSCLPSRPLGFSTGTESQWYAYVYAYVNAHMCFSFLVIVAVIIACQFTNNIKESVDVATRRPHDPHITAVLPKVLLPR
jgi:hypothetical protein